MAEKDGRWPHHQRWREERMRYEFLHMLYEACEGRPDCAMRVTSFATGLGVWREELFRVVEFLDRKGYLAYHGAGPEVSITAKGVEYIEKARGGRRSIRD